MSAIHIADTGILVAIGTPSNERYRRVQTFATRNNITFVIPERVYEELTAGEAGDPLDSNSVSVDVAIDDGWIRIAESVDYTNPLVSKTMDGIQRYIANADERPEDEIERADPALGGIAAQALSTGCATHAYIYTTDIAAGEGAEVILGGAGYDDSVTFVNGFQFIEDLLRQG